MRVADCMTRDVRIANPEESLQEAARAMAQIDSGVLPVGENDRLVGMITDRDIAVRGVARGSPPESSIRDVMSSDVCYCYDDDDTDEVIENMSEIQVRRLPVVDHDKRLVGIVALSDIARSGDRTATGEALNDIARPSAQHSQSL